MLDAILSRVILTAMSIELICRLAACVWAGCGRRPACLPADSVVVVANSDRRVTSYHQK